MTSDHDGPTYELCVIGAGITGLNALVVAGTYLAPSAKALLVDSRPGTGGMWIDTYDYVRLHQPHGNFTAGNISWKKMGDRGHLATRAEVIDHLRRCHEIASSKLDVEDRLGWEYLSHEDVEGAVSVTLRSPDGHTTTVTTKRLIKAFGHQVQPNEPLAISSHSVRSTTPERLHTVRTDLDGDDAPIWIVGSGKTAMDTAHHLISRFPGRDVSLIAGPGTFFARRDTFFPTGTRRWWGGTPINTMLRQVGRRFDGTNESEVRDWFRSTYGIGLTPDAQGFFSAYLSDAELATTAAGLNSVQDEYLADAVDSGDGVDLVFRSGGTLAVPSGSWLVNCTGSLLRSLHPYEPYVSAGGATLSLQMRSSTTGVFSAFAGYYLPHLMFAGLIHDIELYELDIEELHQKAKPVVIYASMSLALYNLSVISDALPNRVLMGCGLDFDRWYPLPRRMLGVAQFLRTHHRDREHLRTTLDTIGERFDVRCGPRPWETVTM